MIQKKSSLYNHLELSYIVPVFFNQGSSQMLDNLLKRYSNYSSELMKRVQFVFVDDCSPVPISLPKDMNLNILLLRILDDIQWNQAGARNLGASQSHTAKLVLTDVDHFFSEILFRKMLNHSIPRSLYKFKRVDGEGEKMSSACNIFFSSKSVFFKTLGYDEEFCGSYGFEDVMFFHFQRRMGIRQKYFNRRDAIVVQKITKDDQYHSLSRDTTRNYQLMLDKLALLKRRNLFECHSRLFVNFNWEKVEERFMV